MTTYHRSPLYPAVGAKAKHIRETQPRKTIDTSEIIRDAQLFGQSQELISKFLKFPDTAIWKHPASDSSWGPKFGTGKKGRLHVIIGKVQSKNAFGVPQTNQYATFWSLSGKPTLVRIVFADEDVMLNQALYDAESTDTAATPAANPAGPRQ